MFHGIPNTPVLALYIDFGQSSNTSKPPQLDATNNHDWTLYSMYVIIVITQSLLVCMYDIMDLMVVTAVIAGMYDIIDLMVITAIIAGMYDLTES